MSTQRVLIAAGGTGGHLYPAQALAQQLLKHSSPAEILFVAGGLKSNRCFDQHAFPFKEIASRPLFSRNPIKCLKGIFTLGKGIMQSRAIIKHYRPDVIVGFGSYYAVPILIAARGLKIPIVLHEANSIPGRANQWLASFATHVGIHFPSTASLFKCKTVEVGLPLREGYQLDCVSKEKALNYYGFTSDKKTLLIFGGSQGAKAINEQMEKSLPFFQRKALQLIHFTGDIKTAERLAACYADHKILACVKPFEDQMQMAWRAADGFIGRSGASTVAESIEFEVPGILIPYPHATDGHQEKNADFLVYHVKSAWKLLEADLTFENLSKAIDNLFQEKQFLTFKHALKDYKQRPNQLTLCQLILNMRKGD